MSARGPSRPGRIVVLAGVLVLVLVAGIVAIAELARVAGDAAEQEGLAAFYEIPPDVADGAPGTLLQREELAGTPIDARAWRIMYRSTDLRGEPIAVTGIVVVPRAPAPAEGRTVLGWGHPTTGTAPDCAPSRGFDPFIGIEGLRMLLDRGYAVVATDYAGMGTAAPDQYLVMDTAAHTVLDAVRAARAIPEADAGDRVVLWGHSQGGQAVLAAAQEAPEYAQELDVVAVAAAAPAADLTALLGSHLDDISGVTISSYAFPAFVEVYGDSVVGAQLAEILTPQAIERLPEMNRLCLLSHLGELHQLGEPLVGDFFLHDPTTTEPWATLLRENSVGAAPIGAPVLVAQGTGDELVLPADTEAFVAQERSIGTDVDYLPIPLADHATVAYLAIPELAIWLDAHGV